MGKFNLSKLKVRIASALVLIPLTIMIIVSGGWPFAAFILLVTGLSLREWINIARKTPHPAAYLGFGVIYLIGSFICCYLIRDTQGLALSVLFVCMVWSSDIGAYFAGKILGGPKMAVSISPNKTWAGLAGAALFPALIALIWIGYDDFAAGTALQKSFGYSLVFGGGLLLGVVGQLGDLLISFAKRKAGVKDSGNLIPGHGGLLDRIDALLLMAPVFLILADKVFHVP